MIYISEDNKFINLLFQYLAPLLIIAIVSKAFPVFQYLSYLIFPILILFISLALFNNLIKKIKIKQLIIIFGFPAYCLITSFWSLYPMISIQRSIYALFIYTGVLSFVLLYKKFNKDISLRFFLPANILIIIQAIFSLITKIPSDSWTGGNGLGFMGFAGHQNTLAAAIIFTLPGVIALRIDSYTRGKTFEVKTISTKKVLKNFTSHCFQLLSFIFLIVTNLLLLILTYSRAAWLALVLGITLYIILSKKIKLIISFFALIFISIITVISVPEVYVSIESVVQKGDSHLLSRRTILWQPSIKAANEGGLLGLGYGVSAPYIKTPPLTGSYYVNGRYVREKGNSFLALLEETGIFGLILFLLPLLYLVSRKTNAIRFYTSLDKDLHSQDFKLKLNNENIKLLLSVLAALFIHAQFEAWWVGIGSVQFPLFLIYLFLVIL